MGKDIFHTLLDDPLFKGEVKQIVRVFKPNEVILKQGKQHTHIFIVKTGKVKVVIRKQTADGEDINVSPQIELGPEEMFGEFGLYDDLPASADVVALQESELIEIDMESLRTFLDKHREIGYQFLLKLHKILIKRLRHADKAIVNLYAWGMKSHKLDKYLT